MSHRLVSSQKMTIHFNGHHLSPHHHLLSLKLRIFIRKKKSKYFISFETSFQKLKLQADIIFPCRQKLFAVILLQEKGESLVLVYFGLRAWCHFLTKLRKVPTLLTFLLSYQSLIVIQLLTETMHLVQRLLYTIRTILTISVCAGLLFI